MRYLVKIMALVCLVSFMGISFIDTSAQAQKSKRGTPEEAMAMVKRVKQMYASSGPEATFKAVSTLSSGLRDRDLYPYIVHMDGYMAAHFISALRGLNFSDHTDMRGRFFFKNMMQVARTKGRGWANYSFPNPVTKKVEEKSAYIERLDGEYFVAVGVYTKISDEQIIN